MKMFKLSHTLFFVIIICKHFETIQCKMELQNRHRANRHCKSMGRSMGGQNENRQTESDQISPLSGESKFTLIFALFSTILFLLMFLGIVKGFLGILCLPSVGMYGLNLLIELPRPLRRYQEKSLANRQVIYDIGGWPVHPDTLEKSVRLLPKRHEFCLNMVFFLAYPLAACIYICSFCCCIRNYEKSEDNICFKAVNVVRLKKSLSNKDQNEATKLEAEDTKYVINALKTSKESIRDLKEAMK